jgi:NADP-dependent 3-hydroxy acid dehydrogenase YdfG
MTRKAIIIGSTSGIGKGLAECFAVNNYKVGITGRRKELLLELKDENPDVYLTKVLDVTDTHHPFNN